MNSNLEKILNNYIRLEEESIQKINDELNLSDFEKERIKSKYQDRLDLLKQIHYDMFE